jgi:hypothetical protein
MRLQRGVRGSALNWFDWKELRSFSDSCSRPILREEVTADAENFS